MESVEGEVVPRKLKINYVVYTKVLCADSRRYLGDVDFG